MDAAIVDRSNPVKRFTREERLDAAGLVLALLTAACVLEPLEPLGNTKAGDPPRDEVPAWPTAQQDSFVVPIRTEIERVRVVPHAVPLAISGHPDAVVAEPWREAGRRPVAVVFHGLGDRPEPHCEAWRTITNADDFILCLRGDEDAERSSPGRRRFTLAGGEALASHVDAALAALAARYGDRVDPARPLLVGFSLGATEVALLAQRDPARFGRVALVEGGLDVWIDATVAPFAAGGARRVLFACGSPWCTPPARADVKRIEARGVEARVAFADVGHREAPELERALMAEFEWFTEGDERWAPPVEPSL